MEGVWLDLNMSLTGRQEMIEMSWADYWLVNLTWLQLPKNYNVHLPIRKLINRLHQPVINSLNTALFPAVWCGHFKPAT